MAAPLIAYVRTSAGWLRRDPATLLMLGLAVVASSSAVCCVGGGIEFTSIGPAGKEGAGCGGVASPPSIYAGLVPSSTSVSWMVEGDDG